MGWISSSKEFRRNEIYVAMLRDKNQRKSVASGISVRAAAFRISIKTYEAQNLCVL